MKYEKRINYIRSFFFIDLLPTLYRYIVCTRYCDTSDDYIVRYCINIYLKHIIAYLYHIKYYTFNTNWQGIGNHYKAILFF